MTASTTTVPPQYWCSAQASPSLGWAAPRWGRWEGERAERKLFNGDACGHGHGCDRGKFDGAFSDDVASEEGVGLLIDDQLAEAGGSAVDDRSRQRSSRMPVLLVATG